MRRYFIYDGQVKKGPFDLEQLKSQVLHNETPVWYEGLTDWAMAGNIEELKEIFVLKSTPPPIPKAFEKNVNSREKILNSFADATELYPKKNRRRFLIPIIISVVIIAGIVIALMYFKI